MPNARPVDILLVFAAMATACLILTVYKFCQIITVFSKIALGN